MKHSEGKIKAAQGQYGIVLVNKHGELWYPKTKDELERLAACWNACEGIETEDLNHWNLKRKTVFDTQAELNDALNLLEIAIEERDKERAVKKELLGALKEVPSHESLRFKIGSDPLLDKIDELIAKIEGSNNETHKKSE